MRAVDIFNKTINALGSMVVTSVRMELGVGSSSNNSTGGVTLHTTNSGHYGRQTIRHASRMMNAIEDWKPPSKPYIRERYEPKFRIINKDNPKDLRK